MHRTFIEQIYNHKQTLTWEGTLVKNQFLKDVVEGLSCREKQINCKYFYDAVGSNLFNRISSLDEYYLLD